MTERKAWEIIKNAIKKILDSIEAWIQESLDKSDLWWDKHGSMLDLSVVIVAIVIGIIVWAYSRWIKR